MKNAFTLIFVLMAGALLVWSCNNSGSEGSMAKTESDAAAGASLPAFQIPADSAHVWMSRWIDKRHSIDQAITTCGTPSDTSYLVYGYQLPRLELDSMLQYLGPDPKVWAMIAIKYDSASQMFVPELVFAAEPNAKIKDWSYYDFTAPCPTSCPDDKLAVKR